MKKDQAKAPKTGKKKEISAKKPQKGASYKLQKQETAILDFDLEEENKGRNRSKDAADAYGGQMPKKPVTVDTGTLELLDAEEILNASLHSESRKTSEVRKKKEKTEKTEKKEKREKTEKTERPAKAVRTASTAHSAHAKHPETKSKKKKRRSFLADFGAMDAVVALTGVVVLFVAVLTVGIYTSARTVKSQVAAMAEVGEKMETIGIAGDSVFTAVADARIAGLEAAGLDPLTGTEGGYDEKELSVKMEVGLKLTSVQRDLKIKFTNRSSGKLIGNYAFTVQIKGPENLTKTDDDKDGIIYISSIKPGEYTVTITEPEEIEKCRAAGVSAMVTVKDQIEYKKIDVTDEVKSETEINAAKEDTEVKTAVESVNTDTVEWVESTKTLIEGGTPVFEEVKKADIPAPGTVAFLEDTVGLPVRQTAYFAHEILTSSDPYGVMPITEPQEEELRVTRVSIDVEGECVVGGSVTLRARAETEGEGSLQDGDYEWSGDLSGSGPSISVPTGEARDYNVTVSVKGETAQTQVTIREKEKEPATVSGVSVSASSDRVPIGESVTLTAKVSLSDGSDGTDAYDDQISWSKTGGGTLSGSGESRTLTSETEESISVTASVEGKTSAPVTVTFYRNVTEKKVESVRLFDLSLTVGETRPLNWEVKPDDATDKSLTWTVTSGGDVVSVDGSGNVKGLKSGTAKVRATAKDGSQKYGECTVTVNSGLSVSMSSPGSIRAGEEKQLTATFTGSYNKDTVEWSVSDSRIASIDSRTGKVKGLAVGKVNVTVSVKGGSQNSGENSKDTKELVVLAPDAVIALDPSSATIRVQEKQTIKATVNTTGNKAVEWTSSDESTVKIIENRDDSCTVQGLKPGKAVITAISKENRDKKATCEITVELENGAAPLKDKNGNLLYYRIGDLYYPATVADYYKYDVFYRQVESGQYRYTGWQNIDGKRYYFDKNGVPVTGEQIIQGMKYTFQSDGSLQTNAVMGIDVSKHNGNIDWNAVKNAGVNFVIIRCGYRGSSTGVLVEDQKFKANIQGAAAAGLKVGIYFFSQAVNEVEAVEEASMTIDLIRKYSISYPVYMDVESANGRADHLDSATRTKVIRAFCETVRGSGYTAGVYANKSWLTGMMNTGSLGSYKIWLAQYAAAPTYNGRYEMWQYSSKGKIAGIPEAVDLNISYMSY